jgi:hypothetical protein
VIRVSVRIKIFDTFNVRARVRLRVRLKVTVEPRIRFSYQP